MRAPRRTQPGDRLHNSAKVHKSGRPENRPEPGRTHTPHTTTPTNQPPHQGEKLPRSTHRHLPDQLDHRNRRHISGSHETHDVDTARVSLEPRKVTTLSFSLEQMPAALHQLKKTSATNYDRVVPTPSSKRTPTFQTPSHVENARRPLLRTIHPPLYDVAGYEG